MPPDPDARPSFGDRTAPGDPLDAVALGTAGIEVVASTASTNTLLATRARAGAPGAEAVVAEHQTQGRGRLDRSWEAPAGSALTFSVLLRPRVAPERWPWIPLLAGLAVRGVLVDHGYPAGLKWPNDVLLPEAEGEPVDRAGAGAGAGAGVGAGGGPGRKVAGLLAERVETPTGPAVVVGIGLNVHLAAADLPVPTATSLALADPGRTPPPRTTLVRELVAALRSEHEAWQREPDDDALRAAYAAACVTLGRTVRVDLPAGAVLHGRAVGIDATGRLEVAPDGGGAPVPVAAGDVVHVRAAAGGPPQVR